MQLEETLNSKNTPIVVCAPSFNPNIGGIVVLHYLVDRLRSLHANAYVYPLLGWKKRLVKNIPILNLYFAKKLIFKTNPEFNTPIAPRSLLRDAVCVYPEIVRRTPFKSKHVIRWHLYKHSLAPTRRYKSSDDNYFFNKVFFEENGAFDQGRLLKINYILSSIYFVDESVRNRSGIAIIFRKSIHYEQSKLKKYRMIKGQTIVIDHMSHEQIAWVFNRAKYLYCYDHYTFYLKYAILAGCIPIVAPLEGVSKYDWQPDETERYGIAYGDSQSEIDWALSTRAKAIAKLNDDYEQQMATVSSFLDKMQKI